jgi:hypothetical protein
MKSILKVALLLSLFTCSISAHAQTPSSSGTKITKKSQLHDGCHGHYAKMLGKPCH